MLPHVVSLMMHGTPDPVGVVFCVPVGMVGAFLNLVEDVHLDPMKGTKRVRNRWLRVIGHETTADARGKKHWRMLRAM